ncbi:hypothetical protein N7467_007930 [Penicillium canescens]|nr:hypothetical protein N7467_007930 [Penicillium canescens]
MPTPYRLHKIVGSKSAAEYVLVDDPIVLKISADDKEAGNVPNEVISKELKKPTQNPKPE